MEAIKGQDALKLAVEKLEADIFKDWPTKKLTLTPNRVITGGILMLNASNIKIIDCTLIERRCTWGDE